MNKLIHLLTLISASALPGFAQDAATAPVNLGSRLELMIDDHLAEKFMGSAALKLHHPVTRDIVIKHDAPWEGNGTARRGEFLAALRRSRFFH